MTADRLREVKERGARLSELADITNHRKLTREEFGEVYALVVAEEVSGLEAALTDSTDDQQED